MEERETGAVKRRKRRRDDENGRMGKKRDVEGGMENRRKWGKWNIGKEKKETRGTGKGKMDKSEEVEEWEERKMNGKKRRNEWKKGMRKENT